MIRDGVYRVNLGDVKRGHEQRGRRYGLVLSPTSMRWNIATIVPMSTSVQPTVFRPELELAGTTTLFLVDQIRTIDVAYIQGDPVHCLDRCELAEIEHAAAHYLGL